MFKEWLLNNLDLILSVIVVLASSIATLCGFRVSYKKDTKKLEIANLELAKSKAELEKAIVQGAFIICPHCGSKILMKDVEVQIERNL